MKGLVSQHSIPACTGTSVDEADRGILEAAADKLGRFGTATDVSRGTRASGATALQTAMDGAA
ncbi:MAG: hypothetical protein HC850_13320 [Rhodomicrobium sp.]|nr:hypothetical protein [Rhodomicrobium sp.]